MEGEKYGLKKHDSFTASFQTEISLTKIEKYDQMPLIRVDLHMLKFVWYKYGADRSSLSWEI